MSEKVRSTSPSTIYVKNWQKTISTEDKLDVINQFEKGEQIIDISHNVRFPHGSVHKIRDSVDRITESVKS